MTKKEEIYFNNFQKLLKKRQKLRITLSKNLVKAEPHHKILISKIEKSFNFLKKLHLNHSFSYKFIPKPRSNSYQIQFFKTVNNNDLVLIFEVFILNIPTNPYCDPNNVEIKFNQYSSHYDFKWELEKNILIGEISEFLLKNNKNLISKITTYSNSYINSINKIAPKVENLHLLLKQNLLDIKTLHSNNLYKYLRKGISLSTSCKYNNISFSLSDDSGIDYKNIIEVKLLESNELQVITLKEPDSEVKSTHILQIEGRITEFIEDNLSDARFFIYIKSIEIYDKIVQFLLKS